MTAINVGAGRDGQYAEVILLRLNVNEFASFDIVK